MTNTMTDMAKTINDWSENFTKMNVLKEEFRWEIREYYNK